MSSRTHNRPSGATAPSDGGSTSPADGARTNPFTPPPDGTAPAKPRWLLSIPDANVDRILLTRRDIEQLFGVSKARAATLMQTFGAEMTGKPTDPASDQAPAAAQESTGAGPRSAARRKRLARLVAELRKVRIAGIF